MKVIITSLIFTLCFSPMIAQKCDDYDDCYTKGRNDTDGIEYFTKAIKYAKKENKNPSDAYFLRGIKYYNLSKGPESTKENQNAEEDFLEVLKIDPNNYYATSWLSALYEVKVKDYNKGVLFMDAHIAKHSNDPRMYYDRGNIHRYYGKTDLALADFKKAYEIMVSGNSLIELTKENQGNITTFYVLLKLKNENTHIHNDQSLALLSEANQLFPNNDKILSELALAYLDTGNSTKAFEAAHQALALQEFKNYGDAYKTGIPGTQSVLGYEEYSKGNYTEAIYRALTAANEDQRIFRHPAIVFYAAIIKYDRYTRISPNKFPEHKSNIIHRLKEAAELADGTVYQYMADDANKYIFGIKIPNGKPEDDPSYEMDFKEFLMNFEKLPTNFSFTSQTIKGRVITNLAFVKKWLRPSLSDWGVDNKMAIGKYTECNGNHIRIIGVQSGNTTYFRFMKIGPKGEYLGWKPISSLTLYHGKASYLMNINLSKNGNELNKLGFGGANYLPGTLREVNKLKEVIPDAPIRINQEMKESELWIEVGNWQITNTFTSPLMGLQAMRFPNCLVL